MNALFRLLILLSMAFPSRAVPRAPTDTKELQDILLRRKKIVAESLDPAERIVSRIEQQIGLRDGQNRSRTMPIPNPDYGVVSEDQIAAAINDQRKLAHDAQENYAKLSDAEKQRYSTALRDEHRAMAQVVELLQEAISLTQDVYGLVRPKSGTIVNGPPPGAPGMIRSFVGRQASWSPKFNPTLSVYGETRDDCRVQVGPEVFFTPRLSGRDALSRKPTLLGAPHAWRRFEESTCC